MQVKLLNKFHFSCVFFICSCQHSSFFSMDHFTFFNSSVLRDFFSAIFFIVSLITFAHTALSIDQQFLACEPKTCGNGLNISYPFWIDVTQPDYCGYPGFRIICKNKEPIFQTTDADYTIRHIFYRNQTFRVLNSGVINKSCPAPTHNFTTGRAPFEFGQNVAQLLFFYNCTTYSDGNSTFPVLCDTGPTLFSYAKLGPQKWPSNSTNSPTCKNVVGAPVELDGELSSRAIEQKNYTMFLENGFSLKWITNDCYKCLRSGGRCGIHKEKFICFCTDHPRPEHCNKVPHSAQANRCAPFTCGNLEELVGYPFSNTSNPECGVAHINCTAAKPKVQFHKYGKWYLIDRFKYFNQSIWISDVEIENHLISNKCDLLSNFTYNATPPLSLKVSSSHPFFKCKRPYPNSPPNFFKLFSNYTSCSDYDLYFYHNSTRSLPSLPEKLSESCSVVHSSSRLGGLIDYRMPKDKKALSWATDFMITWNVSKICMDCYSKGRICQFSTNNTLECPKGDANVGLKIGIGVGTGVGGILVSFVVFMLYQRRKRNKFSSSSTLISRELSSNHSNIPDPEKGSIYFKTPIFTYKELDEATNHFDSKKELGDGGFGTVYHGKLRDGRVVAVKRLFEHNYKRVDQFMNEIAILSGLRHRNLVSLYGCTSRHSRELLLVYEYVPNGTVADHLHGDRATACQLTWPIRLSIAIESADALAYLHASQIIHRDVKTNNILLDNGFHVKVADFGLSRLFPENVTHVSTAPQGTPGYVDPEYYQCYQLNDKSDVYSFGVVLIELISSKPAVDIGRHRHEINLANMAVNKIQHQALHELVDLSLGFDSDYNVRDRITLVAELAFRCLQQEKEMRPCMIEVLETLRGIENEEYKKKKSEEIDTSADARLLKNSPLSPVSVTDKWASRSTTPNTSS